MFHYFTSVLFLNLVILQAFGNVTSACNHSDVSMTLLDVAMEMIVKAKLSIPVCPTYSQSSPPIIKPVDCEEILLKGQTKTGIYTIWPRSRVFEDKPLQVFCDMGTDGGGWTIIQRRGDFGRTNEYFFQDWASYKKGFGDIDEDFWLGNDNIFALTNQRLYSIRFDLKAVDGEARYALYESFWIDDENNMYTLHIKDYKGNAGDSVINQHDNSKFSTKDKDNDNNTDNNCASLYKGGWWYNSCHHSNLNGLYLKGYHKSYADGVNWLTWRNFNESLLSTEMKIRPFNFKKIATAEDTPEDH